MTNKYCGPHVSAECAVANLMASYAFLNDDADFSGLGELFADGTFRLDAIEATGKVEIEQLARGIIQQQENGRSATMHEITNMMVDVDEQAGVASARAYWTVYRAVPGEARQALLSGRYSSQFQRRDGAWSFSECNATTTWKL